MDHHPFHIHGHAFQITETDGGEIPENMLWPETSALVAVGQTRNLEFVADNPGDWACHCHMTHHTMNQMGHGLANMVGADARTIDRGIGNLIPNYMTMGTDGMGDMGLHADHMEMPENSIPMVGAHGPYSYIGMGGMFNILKVRAGMELAYRNSRPVVVLKGVSVMGVPIPNAWLGGLKNIDLVEYYGTESGFWKTFADGVDSISIEEGNLTMVLKE